jgi:mannose-6-phosphate isomerase-like protein (cupin superfamily)
LPGDQASYPEQEVTLKHWRCTVCGYVHIDAEPPARCPNCGAPREKFVEVPADFDLVQMPYAQKLAYGADTEVLEFFGDFQTLAPFIYNLPVGKAVRLHKHPNNDELFLVLKGRLKFRVGDREFIAVPGDVVKGRKNIGHAFANVGDEPAAFLSVKGPKPVSVEFLE